MSSQISQIFQVIDDIKNLIKDSQYKTNFENLRQSYNNNNNNYNNNNNAPNETPTTERDVEVKRLTDENLRNVKLRVAEIKQLAPSSLVNVDGVV